MPKSTLEINDDFIFQFPKQTVGRQESHREIPVYVFSELVKSLNDKTALSDESFLIVSRERYDSATAILEMPYYLMEVSFVFRGEKIGGIQYMPKFAKESIFNITFQSLETEDDQHLYFKAHINATLVWDYKAGDFNKHKLTVEKGGSIWDNAKINMRLNLRSNFKLIDAFKYNLQGQKVDNPPFASVDGKTIGNPEESTNIGFVLAITPNTFSIINNQYLFNTTDRRYPNEYQFSEKNITLKSKFFQLS